MDGLGVQPAGLGSGGSETGGRTSREEGGVGETQGSRFALGWKGRGVHTQEALGVEDLGVPASPPFLFY